MKIFFLLNLLIFSNSHAFSTTSPFRGYSKINQIIHERVAQDNGFELGQYLDKVAIAPQTGDLLSLLGTYDGADTNSTYRNGDPNSINMLLWYIVLDGLAVAIAGQCDGGTAAMVADGPVKPLVLRPAFSAALRPLCAWPDASAKTDAVLFGFWSGLVGFDAPPEEFQAWKTYFLDQTQSDQTNASAVIADMGLAALFNPYFLLEE